MFGEREAACGHYDGEQGENDFHPRRQSPPQEDVDENESEKESDDGGFGHGEREECCQDYEQEEQKRPVFWPDDKQEIAGNGGNGQEGRLGFEPKGGA